MCNCSDSPHTSWLQQLILLEAFWSHLIEFSGPIIISKLWEQDTTFFLNPCKTWPLKFRRKPQVAIQSSLGKFSPAICLIAIHKLHDVIIYGFIIRFYKICSSEFTCPGMMNDTIASIFFSLIPSNDLYKKPKVMFIEVNRSLCFLQTKFQIEWFMTCFK